MKRFLSTLLGLTLAATTANAQTPRVLDGDKVSRVGSFRNYIRNPDAMLSASTGITLSNATATRSTTTPLGETGTEFNVTITSANGTVDFLTSGATTANLGGASCEVAARVRGFQATSKLQAHDGTNVLASVDIGVQAAAREVVLNFPCPSDPSALRGRITDTSTLAGTNEVAGTYLGKARNIGDAANITSWTTVPSYVAITNGGTGTQTTVVEQARVGDTGWFRVSYSASAAGSGTGNIFSFTIPPGLTIDTAKLSNVSNQQSAVGSGFFVSGVTGTRTALSARVTIGSNTQVRFPFNGLTRDMSSADFDANGNVGFLISLPIANWPTASSAVTPANQNVWGGARFVASPQYVSTTSSTKTILNNSAFSAPTLFGTATAASSTCGLTTNDIGLCIPSLPAGTYRVVANTVARATTAANCQYDLTLGGQIVTGAELQAQATSETSNIATISGLVTITSALANTSSTIRVARNSGSGNCGVVVDNGTNAEKYPTIEFSPVQSNVSPVFIQSPVRAAQTGVAAGVGEVGRTLPATLTNQTATRATAGAAYTNITAAGITAPAGCWHFFLHDEVFRSAFGAANSSGYGGLRIFNSTDAVGLTEASLSVFISNNAADTEAMLAGQVAISAPVCITSPKTFEAQVSSSFNGGSGVTVGNRATGRFYAIQLPDR
jgi:hypothetical protein